MSVITPADEKIDEAREHLTIAYKAVLSVLDPDIHGSDQYSTEYTDGLLDAAKEILIARRKL